MKASWIALAAVLCAAALYVALAPRTADQDETESDYDDLAACAFLTSLDSKRSLYLSRGHVARLSQVDGAGTHWDVGTWTLLDDEKRRFEVNVAGNATKYTLISAPEGEGCMLVPGDPSKADLSKAWFSTLQDPK